MLIWAVYFLFLVLYMICVAATITNPKLPPNGDPALPAAEKVRDQWVIGHSLLVIVATIFAILHIEDYQDNIESMGACSVIVHGFLFQFSKHLSKKFWVPFFFTFDMLLILYASYLHHMH